MTANGDGTKASDSSTRAAARRGGKASQSKKPNAAGRLGTRHQLPGQEATVCSCQGPSEVCCRGTRSGSPEHDPTATRRACETVAGTATALGAAATGGWRLARMQHAPVSAAATRLRGGMKDLAWSWAGDASYTAETQRGPW
jgi:hypothetical protein